MTRFRLRHPTLLLTAALVLAAAGCGGEEPQGTLLGQQRADTLLDLLDDAQNQFEDGECDELEGETLPELEDAVMGVSNDVDESFRAALDEETQALQELADDCRPEEETTTAPEPVEPAPAPEPVEPVPEPEPVPPTTTEEEPTEEEPPPEEEPVPPEDDGSGEGNGNGSSGSGSGGAVEPPGGVAPPSGAGGPPSSQGEAEGGP